MFQGTRSVASLQYAKKTHLTLQTIPDWFV